MLLPASNGVCGVQLWKTDGTEAGTVLVKNININGSPNPANRSSNPGASIQRFPFEFVVLNGAWYFTADDGVSGVELWKTDGTEAGTIRVKDIKPGVEFGFPGSSFPFGFTAFNGALYFSAYDGVTGRELWKSDGTEAGTVRVKDIDPRMGFSGPLGSLPSRFRVFNNALYFSANDGVSGEELWKTDGTEAGTVRVKDINLTLQGGLPAGSFPSDFTVFNNALYFSAYDGVTGDELWKSDGTEAGTVRVKDIDPRVGFSGPLGSLPSRFRVFNNALYFSASDGVNGTELWKTDGTEAGTVLVKDINPGVVVFSQPFPNSSIPLGLTVFNNALYFQAEGAAGTELWTSDGTEAGTMLVKDICPGSCDGLFVVIVLTPGCC